MPYWRLHYHLVWATKNRMPLITPDLESGLHGYLIGKADELGAIVHEVESVEDHIHLVASVPPKVSISDFVGQLKGASAHHVNHLPGALGSFGWQRGYGVVLVSPSGLDKAIEYVRDQRTHHRENTAVRALECIEVESLPRAGE